MVASIFQPKVSTRRVYAMGALAAVLFGYDIAIIGAALLFIKNDLPLTDWWNGAVGAAVMLGAMVGALGSGPLADRQGRQRILLAAAVLFAIGAVGSGVAMWVEMLVSFRFLLGLAIGIASVTVPLYLAEMAPAGKRGAITSLNQYMIIAGVVLASAVGYGLAFASKWQWQGMLLIGVIPAVVLIIGILGMPDTPRSLVRRGHPEQGRAVLLSLRGDPAQADRELTEIVELERQESTRTRARLFVPWVRRLLLLGALLAIFQQITGINAIVTYQPTVLTGLGMDTREALLFGLFNGLVNVLTITVVIWSKVVDRRGRKPILLAGLVGMSASLLALGVAVLTLPVSSPALLIIAIVAIVLFTNTFSATWGPVLWVQLAEIFPLAVRGSAMAIATLFNWLAAFLVTLTFPHLTALAGTGSVFIAYALAGVVIFPIVWRMVPETKGRSLESLEAEFRNGTRLGITERTTAAGAS
ncbi:MAG TPA: sugar porter family MFS transporter [Pseudonocardiaceae bacterium]|nr:sugar porter family MFS transporter [Pseudonocardiaceae bacterium]